MMYYGENDMDYYEGKEDNDMDYYQQLCQWALDNEMERGWSGAVQDAIADIASGKRGYLVEYVIQAMREIEFSAQLAGWEPVERGECCLLNHPFMV